MKSYSHTSTGSMPQQITQFKGRNTGFTLLEIMVTLAIVAILLTVGVPSLRTFTQQNTLISASNELVSAFHIARSEAIKSNQRVTVCESNDGVSCANDGSWRAGWIVFIDADLPRLQGTEVACTNNNTDCLLRVYDGYDDARLSITGVDDNDADASAYTFTSRGLPKDAAGAERSGNFSVCMYDDSNNVIDSRAVVLGFSGRVRISDDADIIDCPAAP